MDKKEKAKLKKKAYMKEYVKRNKDKIREYAKKYRTTEAFKKRRSEYYQEHKKEIYESQSIYRKAHAKRISQQCQESRKRRVEKLKADGVINAWAVATKGETPRYE